MISNYLIIAVVAAFMIFAASPITSLILLAFSVPVINWIFTSGSFEVPLSDLIAMLAVAGWLLSLVYRLIFKPGAQIKIQFPLLFPFFAFIVAAAISLISHPHPISGLYYIARWLLLLYVAYILLPANLIKDKKRLTQVLIALALSSLVVAISGWLSLWGQDWTDSFFRVNSLSFGGIYPFGTNHNLIAEFLCVGAFIWLALKEMTEDKRLRRFLVVIFIFTVGAAVLTFSRAAWITLAIQASVYFIWKNQKLIKRQEALIILSGLAITVLMIPLFGRMVRLQADNVSSTENRVILSEIALKAWREHPYTGAGIGRFTDLVASNIRFTAKYGAPLDSHGFLQKTVAETGALGLLAWLFLIIFITRHAIDGLKQYAERAPWLLPLWIAAGGGLFFQLFNTSYYKGKVWLVIAVAMIATTLAERQYGRKN